MTSDEMEAESGKYSNRVLILLPLTSGLVAVFNNARQRQAIVPWSQVQHVPIHMPEAVLYQPSPVRINLKELGL